jgi:hypothetical protein
MDDGGLGGSAHMTPQAHHAVSRARRLRARAVLSAFVSSMLVVALVGPPAVAAASPHEGSAVWTPASARGVSHRRVDSAKAAGRAAIGNPRNHASRSLGPRPVKIAHPSSPVGLLSTSDGGARVAPTARRMIIAPSDLAVAARFSGLTQGDGGGYRPPDPWVAVSGTYVVQAVNSTIRISSRVGTEISSVPVWALFAMPAGQNPSDPRLIWDATHGRWLGVAISFNNSFTNQYLYLAVSDGADPTGGWSTFAIAYGDYFPDYPSIASSTDKIVLTDNLFAPDTSYYGSDIQTFTWASVLTGGILTVHECLGGGLVHPRAAQILSPTADVHLIHELISDGTQVYYRITGTGRCDTVVNFVNRTDFTGFAPFSQPPAPRQAPGDTIGDNVSHFAIDERPTDAIWQNNKLYWVSTFPWTYDGGTTVNDAVVIWAATTATTGQAVEGVPQAISGGDGIDDFMGGIGLTRNGTLVTIYSESSPSQFVSMEANQIPPGSVLATPIHLDDGDATYPEERWGDYAGVAMDPVGSGSVWATHEVSAADGTWRTDVVRLVVDNDNPGVPGIPTSALVVPTALTRSVPVRLAWAAATDGLTNVASYEVAQQIDGGGFAEIAHVGGTSLTRQLLVNHTYQFQIRAVDAVGHMGSWRLSTTLRPYLYQSSVATVVTGSWHTATSSYYSGGSARYATAAGASATFRATSARSIAIVATKAKTRGSFKVYVDGVYKRTISTYSTTTKYRQLVYQFSWSSAGTHKVKIVVSGTSGRPRVDLDAFVVLR